MLRSAALIFLSVALAGCYASNPKLGNDMYNAGKHAEAITYWNKSKNHPDSQYGLGLAWLEGLSNTPINKNEAAGWFLKAAKQGHLSAMNNLGVLQIEAGNKEAGRSWLNLAARNGHPLAVKNLKHFGYEVPAPDLYNAKQRASAEQAKRDAEIVAGMFSAFVQGYTGNSPYYRPPAYSSPKIYDYESPQRKGGDLSAFNCGVKPIPAPGYNVGSCINGQWQMVSDRGIELHNCGVKPVPPAGYSIGGCVNGQWQMVSNGWMDTTNCGLKPLPPIGYSVGPCVNGQWQMISN
ncbi:tetratricopeptide repeat protein [Neptuniibacter halophilus]|uniref:tetratricopeptide repeat protein n=1 Tax=Neptuniibacter halophilus TaxID=651666 RepID=UPI00257328AA|nr:hypothetical protein [Neptuniibacter halophilus]